MKTLLQKISHNIFEVLASTIIRKLFLLLFLSLLQIGINAIIGVAWYYMLSASYPISAYVLLIILTSIVIVINIAISIGIHTTIEE